MVILAAPVDKSGMSTTVSWYKNLDLAGVFKSERKEDTT